METITFVFKVLIVIGTAGVFVWALIPVIRDRPIANKRQRGGNGGPGGGDYLPSYDASDSSGDGGGGD